MNCEEGKERVSSLRQQMGKDEHEYQRNSTAGNAKSQPIEGHRKNVSSFLPRADHLTINGSEREKSQKNISRDSRSVQEFVQKEIIRDTQNDASLSETSSFHSMNMELIRLRSFQNFPAARMVSTLQLARQGFYHSGEGDMVICFACGGRKQNWRSEDIIDVVHRSLSPNCPLLMSLPTTNVQVGDSIRNGHKDPPFKTNEEQQSETTRTECLTSNEQPTSKNIATRKGSAKEETGNTTLNTCTIALDQQTLSNKRNGDTHIPTPKLNPIDHLTRARLQQEKIDAFLQGLDPLGINFDRPKYPSYAVVAVRISSFSHWPSTLTQTPRALAIAGFFYAGYGDYTRCFFCGGGLRNWEPGDDPWTEHARWFPKCAFTRQNKGDQFVALVQVQHQELVALEASNGHHNEQTNGLDLASNENSSQLDVTSLPAFQSIQEMGYQSHIIRRAFDLLKKTKEPIDVKAEDLLDVIVDMEENAGNDILPSSVTGTTQEVKEVKVTATRSNTDTNNTQGKLTNPSVKSTTTGSGTSGAEQEITQSLLEENRQLKDLMICKICMENEASIAMLPCGHLCCCTDCAPAMRKCPICRQFVKGTVRTWLA
uniref:Inhibitor of apoptosis n=1 Tax=Crassostrea virginica TaxID=6565 RepID=A0A8B8AFL3_CRAVI|nr:putative inhibitor of apoptosis [Crassostrea virginica]XP_022288750.1 putative inhibitor of apoptosis [Crassostrea virginica]XP_022288751.1 putative inhibitor of apoptosis [Crassostrea virginica]XP_022288752.1 putative inhibitor of apoptosis [Crassostrea virginica]XP_022288753.1 putative inhibitor of apoptosis [Crassostrea virginica]XP_022288754.1 putative inhibitor of apoptosis [Crassostrea virginica]